jgi:hypothetical protein
LNSLRQQTVSEVLDCSNYGDASNLKQPVKSEDTEIYPDFVFSSSHFRVHGSEPEATNWCPNFKG